MMPRILFPVTGLVGGTLLWYGHEVLGGLALLVCAVFAFEVYAQAESIMFALVACDIPVEKIIDFTMDNWMRKKIDGESTIIYDRASGLLIETNKRVLSQEGSTPKAYVVVLKKLAGNPRWRESNLFVRILTSAKKRVKGATYYIAPRWSLPDPKQAKVLEEVDCESSMTRVKEAIRRIINDDPVLSNRTCFDMWATSRGTIGWRGSFDEDVKQQEALRELHKNDLWPHGPL